ncbi:MAG: DUF1189 family protein [Desulfomonile tiedjei]|nr:DUF1189 family protein [Desulfomonile tiedjei]
MGISRSIIRMPSIVALLLAGVCVGLSTWSLISWGTPQVEHVLKVVVKEYDKHLPEITIQDGRASVARPQPYFAEMGKKGEAPIVVDTRHGHESDALDYLKDSKAGFVLSRESLFIKNDGQIRVIPLKGFPDMVLNSASLARYVETYAPRVMSAAAVLVVIYYLLAKTFQILIFALIPYGFSRSCPMPATYGQALKLTVVAMLVPVLANSLQDLVGLHVPWRFLIYFGVFLGALILATVDLVRSARSAQEPWTGITP